MSASRLPLPLLTHLRLAISTVLRHASGSLSASALSRSRRSLARLDDHLLRDIGLTRQEAVDEARRPVWDAPAHWQG